MEGLGDPDNHIAACDDYCRVYAEYLLELTEQRTIRCIPSTDFSVQISQQMIQKSSGIAYQSRRRFLRQVAVLTCSAATGPVASAATFLSPVFDINCALDIVHGESQLLERSDHGEVVVLNLRDFRQYTQEALEYLAINLRESVGQVAVIEVGFFNLQPPGARCLIQLDADHIEFHALTSISANTVAALGRDKEEKPILDFRLHHALDTEAAEMLVQTQRNNVLSISVPSLNEEVAIALRRHDHECYLKTRNKPLSVTLATALSRYEGNLLWLDLNLMPLPAALDALASNPNLTLERIGAPGRSGYLYSLKPNVSGAGDANSCSPRALHGRNVIQ